MSKRTKKMSSKRSAFKLEALEQRQLLATISDSTSATQQQDLSDNGSTVLYDQISMLKSSVTVTADSTQVTRVDFLDADGDIVRAEFAGAGTMTVSLANASSAPVAATKYATTNTYMQGLATITISGSDSTTNLAIYSLSTGNANGGLANTALFGADGSKTGGDNQANVARVIINTTAGNALGAEFGNLYAGNAVFGDTSGTVGIVAPNVQIRGTALRVGDIRPTGTASGVVQIGAFSDTKTLTVQGGTLTSTAAFTTSNINTFASTNGTTSKLGAGSSTLTVLETKILSSTAIGSTTATYSSTGGATTIDGSTATQTSLDAYKNKFLGDVTINGSLAAGLVFRAQQFGAVSITGDLAGLITTDVNDDNAANTGELAIGAVTIGGQILNGGGIEAATSLGTVSVGKGTAGTSITHTSVFSKSTVSTSNDLALGVITTLNGAIGGLTTTGDVLFGTGSTNGTATTAVADSLILSGNATTGTIGSSAIGAISIGGNLYAFHAGAAKALINNGGSSAGSIGAVTITGDLIATGTTFIQSNRNIGAITAKSVLSNETTLISTANSGSAGLLSTTGSGTAGNLTLTTGAITTAGAFSGISSAGALSTKAITASTGNIGNFSVTSGGWTVGGNVTSTAGNIGNITVTAGGLNLASNLSASSTATNTGAIGDITITAGGWAGTGTITAGNNMGSITVTSGGAKIGNMTVGNAGTGTMGNITVSDATVAIVANGDGGTGVTLSGIVQSGTSIGNILVSKGSLTVTGPVSSRGSIGNIEVTGVSTGTHNLTFTGTGSFLANNSTHATDVWTGTSIGNITIGNGTITGVDTTTIDFQANQIGNVSVTGSQAAASTLLKDVIFSAKGVTKGTIATAKIGNVTLDASRHASSVIAEGSSASTSATTGTGFSSSKDIGNVTVTSNTSTNSKIISSNTTMLMFRAGSSEMNAYTAAPAATGGYAVTADSIVPSIGNVTITGQLTGISGNGTAGTGLNIVSGAMTQSDNAFFKAAQNNNATTGTLIATGSSIGTVTISDTSTTTTTYSAGNSATLKENNTGGLANAAVIMADTIGTIKVNGGVAITTISPTGLPLASLLSKDAPATNTQNFDGTKNTSNLVIVVL